MTRYELIRPGPLGFRPWGCTLGSTSRRDRKAQEQIRIRRRPVAIPGDSRRGCWPCRPMGWTALRRSLQGKYGPGEMRKIVADRRSASCRPLVSLATAGSITTDADQSCQAVTTAVRAASTPAARLCTAKSEAAVGFAAKVRATTPEAAANSAPRTTKPGPALVKFHVMAWCWLTSCHRSEEPKYPVLPWLKPGAAERQRLLPTPYANSDPPATQSAVI